ncbi:MAG TPA: hypothetical protein VE685_12055 [Thermoanaerobaculia bacterium]|nr:hypothetical protein [Thermoanaerobaculia bacterium]
MKLAVLLLALFVAAPVMAQDDGFPGPGPMGMKSKIELPLYVNGTYAEDVLFDSSLTVNMGQTYQTADGIRQVDFVATHWHAVGYSRVLGRRIAFTLTPDAAQPTSTATAQSSGSDYPAVLTFRATYDAHIEGLTTLRGLWGLATGSVRSIPPGLSGLDVGKAFEFSDGVATYEFRGGKCAHKVEAECQAAPAVISTSTPSAE